MRRNTMCSRATLMVLAVAMLLFSFTLLAGCGQTKSDPSPDNPVTGSTSEERAVVAQSYSDVYDVIEDWASSQTKAMTYSTDLPSIAAESSVEPTSSSSRNGDAGSALATGDDPSPAYTSTNVQVEGVDEGDVVKTDGDVIYRVDGDDVVIDAVDGATVTEVSRIHVGNTPAIIYTYDLMEDSTSDSASNTSATSDIATTDVAPDVVNTVDETDGTGAYRQIEQLYVSDKTLAIVCDTEPNLVVLDNTYESAADETLEVVFYDVSDPASPILEGTCGQDGYLNSSRMADGTIYLVSSYYVYDADIDKDQPAGYIPSVYENGVAHTMEATDCCILPFDESLSYTVIASYDMASAHTVDEKALLGACDTLYMSENDLYIAAANSEMTESDPYAKDNYTVVDYSMNSSTSITSFTLDAGQVELSASGTVDGTLENQFSLDEYEGNLRVVTTRDSYSYSVYTDEKYGFTDYRYGDGDENAVDKTSNSLFVLDGNLEVIGSIEDISRGEVIYSVRFDGPYGYIVTFRQTDPVLAMDLSDPTEPTITSSLKLPGFSTYMQKYDENHLFGFGRNADVDTGRASDIKLSMFDVSDASDISELSSLVIDARWSEALSDHHAIFVSADDGVVGFPADDAYCIYGYFDKDGFVQRTTITYELSPEYVRGLRIGDCFYVVSDKSVRVLDGATLSEIAVSS